MSRSLSMALLILALPVSGILAQVEEKTVTFSSKDAVVGWAVTGLAIYQDDEIKAAFDGNTTKIAGFVGVALFGDAGQEKMQTLWVTPT